METLVVDVISSISVVFFTPVWNVFGSDPVVGSVSSPHISAGAACVLSDKSEGLVVLFCVWWSMSVSSLSFAALSLVTLVGRAGSELDSSSPSNFCASLMTFVSWSSAKRSISQNIERSDSSVS